MAVTKALTDQIYTILVEECGAPEESRDQFVASQIDHDYSPIEYRFMGNLGFGGKFWRNDNRWYVTYYNEDGDDNREAMRINANARLLALKGNLEDPLP